MSYYDTQLREKVTRELVEKMWEYLNLIDERSEIAEQELGKVIFENVNHPAIVSGTIFDLINEAKQDNF